jgi:hypothetical protein
METAGCELQALVLATSEKGEITGAPFEGVVTVMANDGTTLADNARRERKRDLVSQPQKTHLGYALGLARSKLFESNDLHRSWSVPRNPAQRFHDHNCSQLLVKIAHNSLVGWEIPFRSLLLTLGCDPAIGSENSAWEASVINVSIAKALRCDY